ncbi:MAG: DUF6152 family protein [Ferrovibrio sp.]|uniref:DUF6152 family protein n=1 Tax=Ferrovibrio sp. TaxID=1917215 RepID=UPI0039194EAE
MLHRRFLLAAGLAAIGFSLSPLAWAHHGWGSYDATKTLTLDGIVEKVNPDNPHGELMLKADGKVWHVILSPPSRMANRGKAIAEIKVGDRLVAVGYASKTHANEMRAERITHNGVTVELR